MSIAMDKKEQFFHHGAKAMSKYLTLDVEWYFCPLCMTGYRIGDINKLTLEHVPPESIGGKEICLTCEDCNRKAGHRIDNHVHRRNRVISFAKATNGEDTYEGRVRVDLEDESINADLKVQDGAFQFKVPTKYNNPEDKNQLFDHLHALEKNNGWRDQSFKVRLILDSFSQRRVDISDLKSAYLAAFAFFGYGYILPNTLDVIRKQIAHPESEVLNGFSYRFKKPIPPERLLVAVSDPFECLLVQIDDRFIFLPPMEGRSFNYNDINRHFSSIRTLHGRRYDFPDHLILQLDE